MMNPTLGLVRALRRLPRLALVIGIVACAASPRIASAQYSSWLIRYLSGYDFLPNPPISQDSTRFLLKGWYPYDCGEVVNARVVDPEHVELTLEQGPPCSDTLRTWSQLFVLGVLSAGNHTVQITLTMIRPDSGQVVEQGSFEFGVVDTTIVPPPPPPPAPLGIVLQWSVSPSRPNISEPTYVDLWGRFPYDCGEVADAALVDLHHIELTLRPGPACSDTTRTWRQRFDLGLLPAGIDTVNLRLTLQGPGMPDSIQTGVLTFDVVDSANSPPPPPPPDSLHAVLSSSRPNPFAQETEFGVSLDQPGIAEVTIFDVGGRRVATVFRGMLPRGTSQLAWDGRRSDGTKAPGGIYFYRLAMPGRVIARRVVLLRQP